MMVSTTLLGPARLGQEFPVDIPGWLMEELEAMEADCALMVCQN